MKRFVFVVIGVLLTMGILSIGCTQKETAPPPEAPAQDVTGILTTPAQQDKER